MNPFTTSYTADASDQDLVRQYLDGNRDALNQLLERHQPFIYNVAWKMAANPEDAADLSQEAMLKIVANLHRFRFESKFRTWAYRIVVNHCIDSKKQATNFPATDFAGLGNVLNAVPNVDLSAEERLEHEETIREVRLKCLSGMLLCLNREQRMIYIIGEIFGADHTVGSEMMNISKPNYRAKLSKARKDLYHFMRNQCGLVDKSNPCRCHKKVTVAAQQGLVNAKKLLFNKQEFSTFLSEIEPSAHYLTEDAEVKIAKLHQDHSFKTQFGKKRLLTELLEDPEWSRLLNLN